LLGVAAAGALYWWWKKRQPKGTATVGELTVVSWNVAQQQDGTPNTPTTAPVYVPIDESSYVSQPPPLYDQSGADFLNALTKSMQGGS
jgi:hypothetical protein